MVGNLRTRRLRDRNAPTDTTAGVRCRPEHIIETDERILFGGRSAPTAAWAWRGRFARKESLRSKSRIGRISEFWHLSRPEGVEFLILAT